MNIKKMNLVAYLVVSILHFQSISTHEKMYFCMAADSDFIQWLLNLIGSIHKVNYNETQEIAVYDLGLKKEDRELLNSIEKVNVYDIEMVNPSLLKHFVIRKDGKKARGWYAWKPVIIKQALEKFPYVLYLDAGCSVLNKLDGLFNYIKDNGHFLAKRLKDQKNEKKDTYKLKYRCTKHMKQKLLSDRNIQKNKILNSSIIVSSVMGFSRSIFNSFVLPMYQLSKDLKNFEDDGTCPGGFGWCLHDQSLFSIFSYKLNLNLIPTHKKVALTSKHSNFSICISKYLENKPDIFWHCKGQLTFKNYIIFKK